MLEIKLPSAVRQEMFWFILYKNQHFILFLRGYNRSPLELMPGKVRKSHINEMIAVVIFNMSKTFELLTEYMMLLD